MYLVPHLSQAARCTERCLPWPSSDQSLDTTFPGLQLLLQGFQLGQVGEDSQKELIKHSHPWIHRNNLKKEDFSLTLKDKLILQ